MSNIQDESKEHWYILRLPKSNVKASKELEQEAVRRAEANLPPLRYFAPVFVELAEKDGKAKVLHKPLCLNYVFIRSELAELLAFRQTHPDYNLIRRFKNDSSAGYLYVRDYEMRMFMIMARVYKDIIPCCAPDKQILNKGDRVKIIGGSFAGVEGVLLTQKGKDGGRVVVNVCNQLAVPTLSIRPEYIKVISFASDNKHIYKKLDSYYPRIRRAMRDYLGGVGLDDTDYKNVSAFLLRLGGLDIPSSKIKGKYFAFMLMSHTVLEHEEDRLYFAVKCREILPEITNETTRAFILSVLYVCTKDIRYRIGAEMIIGKWQAACLSRRQQDVVEDMEFYGTLWTLGENEKSC